MDRISVPRVLLTFVAVAFLLAGVQQSLVLPAASGALTALRPAPPPPPTFQVAPLLPITNNTSSIAVATGDFNGDGIMDIAATVPGSGIDVFLGQGSGAFGPPMLVKIVGRTAGAYGLAVGDMNNDGRLDLVVTGPLSMAGSIQVLLGNGDGTFQPAQSFSAGTNVSKSVALADFNGDGILDAVVDNSGGPPFTVGVLFGNGDGTLQTIVNYQIGPAAGEQVAVGDFNGDGRPDIAVADKAVSVLINNGDGTFRPAITYGSGSGAVLLQVADLNNDGKLDIATLAPPGKDIGVLLGNGDGTFQSLVNSPTGNTTVGFALGDFNNDGKVDVAIGQMDDTVSILPGRGDGTFLPTTVHFDRLGNGFGLVAADLNGDHQLDVVVPNAVRNGIAGLALYFGTGAGGFLDPRAYNTRADVLSIATGDFNNDGKVDAAVVNVNNTVTILLGGGNGTFRALSPFHSAGVAAIAAGDFNHDGNLDLAVINENAGNDPGELLIFLGNGDGTFQLPTSFSVEFEPLALTIADFNNDGNPDLAVTNMCLSFGNCASGSVSVLLGKGDGTFEPAVNYNVAPLAVGITTADLNGDGRADLAVISPAQGKTGAGTGSVLLGNGDGTFQTPLTFGVRADPVAVVAADFNGDHLQDLAILDQQSAAIRIFLGNGTGAFSSSVSTTNTSEVSASLAAGDFNGDGNPDLASGASIFTGNGDGTLQQPLPLLAESPTAPFTGLVVQDLDGDKVPDLILGVSTITNSVRVVLNISAASPRASVPIHAKQRTARNVTEFAPAPL